MPHSAHFGAPALLLAGTIFLSLTGCSHPEAKDDVRLTPPDPKPAAGSSGATTGSSLAGASPPTDGKSAASASPKESPAAAPPHFTKPDHVRGIYLTAWSAGSKKMMAKIYTLLKDTSLNSVVIDLRDTGEMYWKTGIPLAAEVHANDIAIVNGHKVIRDLAAHGVYPIARIACFRDNFVPKKFPNRGVETPDGKVWRDRSNHSWLDPYNKENWNYVAGTVDYALRLGFPEIQLDYVRFPSEGKSNLQRFPGQASYADKTAKPEDVIAEFCDFIKKKVKDHGAVFSADIFGIISSSKGDEGIGQELEKVAKPFDVLSPMVYPSHFAAGEYRIKAPNAQPYEIITKSLTDYKKRLPNTQIRPWLQDFTIRVPRQPYVHYGVKEIQAQIKAAHDQGYDDFLMWNASNRYTAGAYVKPGRSAESTTTKP